MQNVALAVPVRDTYRSLSFKNFSCLVVFVFLILPSASKAQFDYAVIEGVDPQTLVQQVLIGQGVETFNITYQGASIARGSFSGESNLGIASGVILTSGRANNSVGPNNVGNKSYNAGAGGDIALEQLCGDNTHDASVLEFDFIPQSNIVEFRYVFGSEEYPEFVNQFNDVFGFFISGPDIYGVFPSPPGFPNGARNIALVPQTLPPYYVSIDNINNGSNNTGPCTNCQYYFHNSGGQYIQYDAFTTVLVASSNVIPCQTYHIKLAVADAVDFAYDTGVFLEANSFSSVGLAANLSFTHAVVDTAVEACNNASIAFKLFQRTSVDYPINLEIGGTAENGIDYTFIPNQIIIPQGDSMATLEIIPVDDGLWEDITETVTIIFNSSLCGVDMDTLTVYIKDYPYYSSGTSPSQIIDCQDTITMYAYGDGGVEPYYFLWSTGDTTETITVSPSSTTQYTVLISDECGSLEEQTINITVRGPTAEIGQDEVNICLNDFIDITVQGGTSWLWMPGGETTQTITVSPPDDTVYSVTVSDECGNSDTDQILVTVGQPFADAGPDADICAGQAITLTANDTPNGVWVWTDMVTNQTYTGREIIVSPPTPREYCVSVTDNCGNNLTDCVFVNVFQLTAGAGPDQVITYGTPTTLHGSVMQGTGPYQYQWEPSDKLVSATGPNPTTLNLYESTVFTLLVTDLGTGCVSEQPDFVTVSLEGEAVSAHPAAQPDTVCSGSSANLFTLPGGGTNNYTYQWASDPPGFTSTLANPEVSPSVTTVYTVMVNDGYNSSNALVTITVNELPQISLLPLDDPRVQIISPTEIGICVFDTIKLNAGNPGFAYLWNNGSVDQTISIQTSGLSFDFQEFEVSVTNPTTGCTGTSNIDAYFTFQNCSYGIDDKEFSNNLQVFPNPSGDGLFYYKIEKLEGETELQVYTSPGKLIQSEMISIVPGSTYSSTLILRNRMPGIYYLKLTNQEAVILRKLIIQK